MKNNWNQFRHLPVWLWSQIDCLKIFESLPEEDEQQNVGEVAEVKKKIVPLVSPAGKKEK